MIGPRLVALLSVLAFLTPSAFAEGTIRISGTGGAIGGMKILGDAFEKKFPGTRVIVLPSTGSTGGIKAVTAGKLDLAVSSRRIRNDEKVPGLVEEPYVKTAFIFATPSSNPVAGLLMPEIQDIYSGKKTTWPGGGRIFLVIRPASDALTVFLGTLSAGMEEAVEAARNRQGIFTGITDQDAADQIERTPGSFGATSYSLVVSEKRRIKALAVDGISPVGRNGINERYPYLMTYYLVYLKGGSADEGVREFIDFMDSKEGDRILRMSGHIPIRKTQEKP